MSATKASFYFNVASREQALCQLVGKAWKRGLAVGVATESEAASHQLDRYLWEVPALGFLPHCIAGSALAPDTPVWLGHELASLARCDIVFNWTGRDLPAGLSVPRVIEIVARQDDMGRANARQRVRTYQQAGYEVDFTDMDKRNG